MTKMLQTGDVILYAREGKSLVDIIFRWAAGLWGHASLYLGVINGDDTVIEAIGRGVLVRRLAEDAGRKMLIMRPYDPNAGFAAASYAWKLASNAGSWYDAGDVLRFVIPRLIARKFGLDWSFGYRSDAYFYCSELVAESYHEINYPILPEGLASIPSDLATAKRMTPVLQGRYPDLEPVK